MRNKPYLKLYICLKIQFFTCGLENTKYMCQSSTMLYRCHGGVCLRKVYIFAITVEWLDLAPKRQIFFRQNHGIFTIWCRKYTQIWPFLTKIAPKIVKKMSQELDSLGLFLQIMKPISSWKLAALSINKMILFSQWVIKTFHIKSMI